MSFLVRWLKAGFLLLLSGAPLEAIEFIAVPETHNSLPAFILEEIVLRNSLSGRNMGDGEMRSIEHDLRALCCVKSCSCMELSPGRLCIRYELLDPQFVLFSASEKPIAADASGTLFFLTPLYSPKYLPTVVFPETSPLFLCSSEESRAALKKACSLLERIRGSLQNIRAGLVRIELMDLSKGDKATCFFRREIVVRLYCRLSQASDERSLFIRLHPDSLEAGLHKLPYVVEYALTQPACSSQEALLCDMRYDDFFLCGVVECKNVKYKSVKPKS